MRVWGTMWPEGENDDYKGYFLTKSDIKQCCSTGEFVGKPVKIEHKGGAIGKVESVWEHDGRMDCILDVNESILEGAIAQKFVETGSCPELSISYRANFHYSDSAKPGSKDWLEVSLVRKGARDKCKIWAYDSKKRHLT